MSLIVISIVILYLLSILGQRRSTFSKSRPSEAVTLLVEDLRVNLKTER
jgi:hypothetical protein